MASVGASPWGAEKYGQPCRECGFDWTVAPDQMVAALSVVPDVFAEATATASGRERHPDLGWDVREYVSHVADNLRSWSERFAGATLAGALAITRYDPDELARVRRYDAIPLAAALWSLRHSVAMWTEAASSALVAGVVFEHVQRGRQPASDAVAGNAHDAWHHVWDVRRTLTR